MKELNSTEYKKVYAGFSGAVECSAGTIFINAAFGIGAIVILFSALLGAGIGSCTRHYKIL